MKKLLLFTGLLTSIFISCSKEEKAVVNYSNGNLENLEVHAVIGDNAVTKTAIQSNGTDIYWTQGDAINLFYGNRTSAKFTSSINSPTASASFQGSITAVTGTNENGNGAQSFWAVYPYNSSNTCNGSGVTLTIPSVQSGVAGTFASNLNPTVATSPGLDLVFYNVGSWFVFSVSRNDIVSATLSGNNSEELVGTVGVTMDSNSRPMVTSVANGSTEITMTPTDSACFKVGKYYYMVLIPQTLSDGYSLTLTTYGGSTATCVVTGEKVFSRSDARSKLLADTGLTFPKVFVDLGLSVKWAAWNIGAERPEEYGDYFAWGETETKAGYHYSNYKWGNGGTTVDNIKFTKYNDSKSWGTVDNKYELDTEDDVAHVLWGDSWRMPTKAELQELLDNCDLVLYDSGNLEFGGVAGWKVTSKKEGYENRFIFLPNAGEFPDYSETISSAGTNAYYWAKTLKTPSSADAFVFSSSFQYVSTSVRVFGLPVRPVCP